MREDKVYQVQVGIIGCGRISGHHCRALKLNPHTNIVAVCDLEKEKGDVYAKEFGIPSYTNYRQMLDRHPEINTVVIATPSGMHFEHGVEILAEYRKNIVAEKPTFIKPSQVEQAYRVAREKNVKIFPVFQNRHNKAVQRVLAGLNQGELGDIRVFAIRVRWCRPQRYYDMSPWRGTFAMDGGALTNQGIHHVDLARQFCGEVAWVQSAMRTLGAKIEVEDTVISTMEFKNGVVGTLEVTTAARPDNFEASISLVGDKGLAQIGGIAVNELQIYTPDPGACKVHSEDFSGCVYGEGHHKIYQEIVDDLRGIKPFSVTEQDCFNSIQLLHSFYVSAETNRRVEVMEREESRRLGERDDELAKLYRTVGVGS